MRITPNWLLNTNLQRIMHVLGDGEVFAVGGCVRDAIMHRPVNDVDLATVHTPDAVKTRIETIPGAVLYPTGIDHGTWTVRIDEDMYEVTTFRKDVATDGRRATVAYADSMEQDAQRRDFTMNALYMDRHGDIYDPTERGLRDLKARRVRFVGDADTRCKEDYLRILRLFRFHAQIGSGTMDVEAIEAATRNATGLQKVSGERKWAEFKKILGAEHPCTALRDMHRAGVLREVMGQCYIDFPALFRVVIAENQAEVTAKWQRRYAVLTDYAEIPFPCSSMEQNYIDTLHRYRKEDFTRVAFCTGSVEVTTDCYIVRAAEAKLYCMPLPESSIKPYTQMKCPANADAFMDRGAKPGRELGRMLREANDLFIESEFKATRQELVEKVFGP